MHMRYPFSLLFISLLFLSNIAIAQTTLGYAAASTAIWQWSTPVKGGRTNTDARAWLWIPSSCKKIKAVIIAQNNMEELSILENPAFRQTMGGLDFAEVWTSPAFDHTFRFTEGAGDVFSRMMDDLAESSGYTELKYSPVIAIGHSAAASWPYYFAAWNPGRTLACLSVSGQWPYFRHPAFAPDIWNKQQNIDYIPSLETMGEYEAANTWSDEGLKERKEHPFMPLSMLACPAEGHFAATQKKIDYLAFYIRKAAQYRLPEYDPLKGPPLLKKIDPTHTGWLMDKWRYNQTTAAAPAPVGKYKGNTAEAFWFFDEETVRVTEKYEADFRDQRAPLLGYIQEGKIARQHDTHLQVALQFLPQEDGISFSLKGAFLNTVPGENPRPAMWTGLPVGSPVGHPESTATPIHIDRVIGPFEKINDTLFRLALSKDILAPGKDVAFPDKNTSKPDRNYALTFVANWPGDGMYKPAVQQAEMIVPATNTKGIEQHISFPEIADQDTGATLVKLAAVSDAGLPVSYTVLEGPAGIKGDILELTKIPPRSRYPVKVTVVAWQYGRTAAPAVKTATPVQRIFWIKAPGSRAPEAPDGHILENTRTQLHSPDGRINVTLYQKQWDNGKKKIFYSVTFKDRPVILESALDIRMDNHIMESALALKPDTAAEWCASLAFQQSDSTSRDTTWSPLYGENAVIRDRYHQTILHFVKSERPNYTMQLICRVYNQGVAFRYYFPENPTGVYYHITAENTEFTMPPDTRAWFTSWAQGPYQLLPLKDWPDESERPLPLQLPGGIFACLAEAQMTDYARTKFKLSPDKPNTICTSLFGAVDGITYFGTPWRAILIGEQATDLIRNEDLLLNLNPPSTLTATDWIRTGKIIRETTLTTEGARASIDFAAAHNLQYILFDWKWYGPAMTFNTDATKVVAPIDMQAVVRYGKEKGIGVWLYVNQQSLLTQLDTILPLYEQWGIKGIKFGFVELGSQRWTVWLEEAIQKAAAHHLMVDVHDEWRPTGEQRTWPNLLSAEGIRGNEEFPDATHNTVLPFTRYIAGPADYTICYYDRRIKTTHAHQLALAAVYYSPLLTLFWYDKPAAYHDEPEVEFFEKIPTNWDETKVIEGQPGEYVTIARRRGDDWFLGTITNDSARRMKIALDFLPKGKKYIATIYSDDPSVTTATHVRRTQRKVDASTALSVELSPSGGQAIWITPSAKP